MNYNCIVRRLDGRFVNKPLVFDSSIKCIKYIESNKIAIFTEAQKKAPLSKTLIRKTFFDADFILLVELKNRKFQLVLEILSEQKIENSRLIRVPKRTIIQKFLNSFKNF